MNPYEVLEIKPGAAPDEIKAAYHRLAKQWHPDRFPVGAGKDEAENKFRQISEAFAMLRDSQRRGEPVVATQSSPSPSNHASSETAPRAPVQDPASKGPIDWFADARKAFGEKDLDRALGLVQYAIKMDASHADFHVFLATVLEARGGADMRPIVRALETALQLNQGDTDTMARLAACYRSLGMQARAEGMLNRVKSLSPNHPSLKSHQKKVPAMKGPSVPASSVSEQGLGAQFADLVAKIRQALAKLGSRS